MENLETAAFSPLTFYEEALENLFRKNLYRKMKVLRSESAVKVFHENKELTLFCANDYLGLTHHPRVIEAFRKTAAETGAGSGAARLISGTSEYHAALEEKLAKYKNKPKALLYTAGYLANLGVLSSLAQEGDLIVMDKLCHASLIDGARLSGAEVRVFPHKNYERCEELLQNAEGGKKFLVSDTVFSMDGDTADIGALIRLKKKHNALLILDEAHGLGVMGPGGRGVTEWLEDEIDVITGTLSKSFGAIGGFAATSEILRDYLVNTSRPFIFATALPPAVCAAASEALDLAQTREFRKKLWTNVKQLRESLKSLGVQLPEEESPILPLLIGPEKEALEISEALLNEGFLIPAVRTPAVAKGKARLRITLSAGHENSEIARLARVLARLAGSFLSRNRSSDSE